MGEVSTLSGDTFAAVVSGPATGSAEVSIQFAAFSIIPPSCGQWE
jgi:hypothetical protein